MESGDLCEELEDFEMNSHVHINDLPYDILLKVSVFCITDKLPYSIV